MPISEKTILKLLLGGLKDEDSSEESIDEVKQKKYTLTKLLADVNEIDVITKDELPKEIKAELKEAVKDELEFDDIKDQFSDDINSELEDKISDMESKELREKVSQDTINQVVVAEVNDMNNTDFADKFKEKIEPVVKIQMDEKGKAIKEALKNVFDKLKTSFPDVFTEIMTELQNKQ